MVLSSVRAKAARPLMVCGILIGALGTQVSTPNAFAQGDAPTAGNNAEAVFAELKSVPKVEVEAQFIQISPDDAKRVGWVPMGNLEKPSVGVIPAGFQAKLTELVEQNKIKILTAPRLQARSNLSATLGTSRGGVGSVGAQRQN